MTARRRASGTRVEDATPFGAVLLRLCDGTSALGAALVDRQGETVDYAGYIDSYEIRVAAAEWSLVLRFLGASAVPGWPDTRQLVVRARRHSFAAIALPEGYALVLQLANHSFALSDRALSEAVREVCAEAGLELSRHEQQQHQHWSRVDVRPLPADPRRPEAVWIGSAWCRVEVLGRYQTRDATGYRARLANGLELNLVRERLGRWYAEDLPEK